MKGLFLLFPAAFLVFGQTPEFLIQNGHSAGVMAVAFSGDGTTLASGSVDTTVKLWEAATGKLLRTLEGHSHYVSAVAFSGDGAILASGSWDHTIKLWNAATGKLLRTLEGHSDYVLAVAFSGHGAVLASGSWDRTVKLWDAATGKLLRTLEGHSYYVSAVAFSGDGTTLASGSGDRTVKLWDAATGKLLHTLEGHSADVIAVAFSGDGAVLASGSWDRTVKLWDAATGKLLRTLEGRSAVVLAVAFSGDGATLASGSVDKTVKLWDAATGKLLRTLEGHSSVVKAVAFSGDGTTLATGSWDNTITIKLWDAATGKLLRTLEGHSSMVLAVAFSGDGTTLASGSVDNTVKLWDAATGKLLRTLEGHSDNVKSVALSGDGATLASGSGDRTVKLWDAATGKLLRTLEGHSADVDTVAFSGDGTTLASGSRDNTIRFWHTQKGITLTLLAMDQTDWVAWTPEGYYDASPNAAQLVSWRVDDRVYSFDQYEKVFHKPDMIKRALRGETLPTPDVRIDVDLPPVLSYLNLINTVDQSRFEMLLEYKGSDFGDMIVLLNGTPFDYWEPPKNGQLRIPLNLDRYKNTIRVLVYDKKLLKSPWLEKEIIFSSGAKGPDQVRISRGQNLGSYAKKYAIIVGISDYEHLGNKGPLVDLKYSHKDAEAFSSFLENRSLSGGGWEIHRLIGEKATFSDLDNILTNVLTHANRRDLIYIFFSGHARAHPLRPQDVYLLTFDAAPTNPRSGYPYRLLLDLIGDTKAEHVVAFIDACNSGSIPFGGRGKPQGQLNNDELGQRIDLIRDNRIIFTSASGKQRSFEEPKWEQGVFTHFLIQGLEGKAPEENYPDYVDLGELFKYVRQNVFNYTEKHPQMAPQLPSLWEKNGAPEEAFPIAIRRN